METKKYNFKKGIPAMLLCFSIWGFQPLYWNLCTDFSTLFLLASRIIFASVFCILILLAQGKMPQYFAIVKDRKLFRKELLASLFLFLDWAIFLYAVLNGKVLETSLGYYIEPIVVFLFGALIFKEKIAYQHFIVLGFIIVGIVLSIGGFEGIPYVGLILPFFFSVYAAIKKGLEIDSIVATSFEITLMVPIAIAYILFARFSLGLSLIPVCTLPSVLLLIGSGIVTAAPMLFYSIANYCLPLTFTGLSQYISPSFGIVCSLIMGEALTKQKLRSFVFIWIGVVIFTIYTIRTNKESDESDEEPAEL